MTDAPVGVPAADDFDGHTLAELGEYLDRGRHPVDPSIESSPACRIALAGLERLREIAGPLLQQDADAAPSNEGWIDEVLGRISLESRAGRRFPFPDAPLGVDAVVTEGALRGLVRAVGDSIPGVLTGRVRVRPEEDGARLDLEVDITVFYGTSIEVAAAEFRQRIARLLPLHAPFSVGSLDLRVRDVLERGPEDRW
jgi:hypothetical protein